MSNSLLVHDVLIDSSHIVSGNLNLSHSMMGETLAADDLTITIDAGMGASGGFYEGYIPLGDIEPYEIADDGIYFLQCAPGEVYLTAEHEEYLTADEEELLCTILPLNVSTFAPGDEMLYFWNGNLVGKYYLQKMARMGRARYKLEATSAVGLLIQSQHLGGMYFGTAAGDVFADILKNVDYEIDDDVANATVRGHLPIASRRDNLQQLLFVTGGALLTDSTGTMKISTLSDEIKGSINAHRCYLGGSVEENEKPSAVQVTEHNFFQAAGTEPEDIYEDSFSGRSTVKFQQPYYDLQCDGGTIIESGANYAVIEANGIVKLTGKPYSHIERAVYAGDNTDNTRIRTVTNATMANPQIAQALAMRVYDYLQCNTRVRQDFLFGNERPGEIVNVINPYTLEMEQAIASEMDITMSGINKAAGTFVVGFEPKGVLSGYQNSELLTGSGEWTVPSTAKLGFARLILVAAGNGGNGGSPGKIGQQFNDGDANSYVSRATTDEETHAGGSGGAGGTAGNGGAGGKIFEITIPVTPGETYAFSCGVGGTGGIGGNAATSEDDETDPGAGTDGTDTTFGTYSSYMGILYEDGYYEPKHQLTLGKSGISGVDGGKGGKGGKYPDGTSPEAIAAAAGDPGEGAGDYSGGVGGTADIITRTQITNPVTWRAGGGGGGGACATQNGMIGVDGVVSAGTITPSVNEAFGGAGGNGASPTDLPASAFYGGGGDGGHGGGGGGGGGASLYRDMDEWSVGTAYAGVPGFGGNGSSGGDGGNGCIVIDY